MKFLLFVWSVAAAGAIFLTANVPSTVTISKPLALPETGEHPAIAPSAPSSIVISDLTPATVTAPPKPAPKSVSVPDAAYAYKLKIPKIGVSANVIGMGTTSDGKMAVPNNFTEVGWYEPGVAPGETGSAVFGAHVDNGGRVNGVFKNLKKLAVGDKILIADQAGKMLTFTVAGKKIYSYDEKNTEEIFGATDKARLNLITCYGRFMPSLNTYDQRLVIFAELRNG
jgi:LPXTG-site transpeptidase (sortase) family protein